MKDRFYRMMLETRTIHTYLINDQGKVIDSNDYNNKVNSLYQAGQQFPVSDTSWSIIEDQWHFWWIQICRQEKETVLLGPMVISQDNRRQVISQILQNNFVAERRLKLIKQVQDLTINNFDFILQFAPMAFWMVTGQKAPAGHIPVQSFSQAVPQGAKQMQEQIGKMHLDAYQSQEMIIRTIQNGQELSASMTGGYQSVNSSFLDNAKVNILQLIFLCTRGAINGHVPVSTAYNLADNYIRLSLETTSVSKLYVLADRIQTSFAQQVRMVQGINSRLTPPIRECKAYIDSHAEKKISMTDLVEFTGYSASYLAHEFKRQLGTTIINYSNKQKVAIAKRMLENDLKPISEIASQLGFSSRNYFSRLFQRAEQLTPQQYRQKYFKG